MSLLDLASLVLAPTATKEGKVYSAIPDTGEGDMTFTRGSSATRVNSAGLIEKERGNLYLRSEEFDNATWTKNGTTVTADSTSSPVGTNTADTLTETTASAFHICYQNTSITSGGVYTFSVYGKYNGRVMQLNLSSSYWGAQVYANFDLQNGVIGNIGTSVIDAQIVSVGNGWYRCSITGVSTATGTGGLAVSLAQSTTSPRNENYTGDGTSGVYVWGAQAEQGLVAQPYIETTTTAAYEGITDDVPRVDYSGGGCPSLKLEPQRTNVLTQSEYFDSWTKFNASVTTNDATSPDGTTNANKLIPNTVATSHQVNQSVTGAAHTLSVFAKASEYQTLALFYTVHDGRAVFNLNAGTITEETGTVTAKIENYGSGWYRCSLSTTLTTHDAVRIYAINGTTWADVSTAGDGTSGIYIYGAMLEAGSYVSSYINSYGTSTTRVADSCSKTGISELIGQTEGTMYLNFIRPANDNVANRVIYGITDDTSDNRLRILTTSGDAIRVLFQTNGNQVEYDVNLSSSLTPDNTDISLAVAYKSGDIAVYVNGTQADTSSNSFTITTELKNVQIGDTFKVNIVVNQAILFTTRLTNDQLEELTK